MGYFTYRVFRNIPLKRLKAQTEANLALYKRASKGGKISVTGLQGNGCSALLLCHTHEEQILRPIGFQLECIWMDVRYQDGDSWDLTINEGTEHQVSHSVNPWAYDRRVEYDLRGIEYRINRVCELWPGQGDKLRPYLLLWRVPVSNGLRTRFKRREGKAHPIDKYMYGDAHQIFDFMRCFGISDQSPKIEIHQRSDDC